MIEIKETKDPNSPKKILIAVPTFESIAPETFKSIYAIQSEHILAFDYVKGYDCARARNLIGQEAVEGEFDYVLMVDSDVIIPPDCLDNMLENPVPMCVGVYPRKNTKSKETELFKFSEKDYLDRFSYDELTAIRMPVKGSGFGCALIDVNVFKTLPFPWFKYVVYDSGDVLSEDLYFCDILRRQGYTIEADTRVKCGHLTRYFQYE